MMPDHWFFNLFCMGEVTLHLTMTLFASIAVHCLSLSGKAGQFCLKRIIFLLI